MHIYEGKITASNKKFALVASRFNELISSKLIDGALDCLRRHEVDDDAISLFRVPGAFEIPLVCKKLALSGRYDAIIALGAIIRGETPHFDYVAAETSKGLGMVALETGIPVLFGVLTTDSLEQALERSGAKTGNKGWDCALGALELLNLLPQIP